MSETVHYKGKLKLIVKTSNIDFLEDICKKLYAEYRSDDLYYDSWCEQLQSELYNEYVVIEDDHENVSVYEIKSKKNIDEYEMFNVTKLDNDEYEYEVMYYNGGMGLSEAIEESFKRLGE